MVRLLATRRRNILRVAALTYRLSGLALAIFLPLQARLENFLRWTDWPVVKLAETGIGLDACH